MSKKSDRALGAMVERFRQGDVAPLVAVAAVGLDENAPAQRWSYANRVLGYATTGTLDCRTYLQWKDAGRQVIEEGAGYIIKPVTYTVEDEETGEKEIRLATFETHPVFGYDKTKAVEDDAFAYEPSDPPPLMDVAERLGVEVEYAPLMGAYGAAETDGGKVTLNSHDAHVFFHELAHAAEAKLNGDLEGGQHADQETRAELVACVLAQTYDVGDYTGTAWKYIEHYNDDPVKAIQEAAAQVGPVLELILNQEGEDAEKGTG